MATDNSSSQPPNTTTTISARNNAAEYEKFKNFAAYTFLFVSPVCIALPPRKLDWYTFSLGAAFLVSANHISSVRSGRSLLGHIKSRTVGEDRPTIFRDLPTPQAEAMREQLRAAREAQIRDGNIVGEELERLKRRQERENEMNIVKKLWMGGEEKGWKERRLREEQKALEEGKGYGDLIKEHIWEVWNWGKKGEEDGGNSEKEDGNGDERK
ncbi:hypothetical protein AJ79_10004 [Helicocarpus griseus UAMH5409]|uniref:Rhomboid family membrane protein n=1 Tax=Helicocarpus griseus UAMH5409 TaxID=1447875 RepID=A0A2B7WFP7_9EURO|nr:hypothetical protein AJ79_10004 [Helicocarpus griseus UAMH5409]